MPRKYKYQKPLKNRITKAISKIWVYNGHVFCTLKGSKQQFVVAVDYVEAKDTYFQK